MIVVAVVRGGGSKADLAAFETEVVARAVAVATKPVCTGIGHTGDESVADLVANRACITPTECGQQLVVRRRRSGGQPMWRSRPPCWLVGCPRFLGDAAGRDAQARGRLTRRRASQLRVHRERPGVARRVAEPLGPRRIGRATPGALRTTRPGWVLWPSAIVGRQDERVRSWRRLLAAYDVDRQLERGYSLTLTATASSCGARRGWPGRARSSPVSPTARHAPCGVDRGPRRGRRGNEETDDGRRRTRSPCRWRS